MNCLLIDQNEESRYKVLKGREIHEDKSKVNIDYYRKRIGVVDKQINLFMSSDKYHIKGTVDEVLTLADGSMASLDYKFAEYRETIYQTHRYQAIFYSLLIKENFGKPVQKAFIVYTRSKNLLKEVPVRDIDFYALINMIEEIFLISEKCYFPRVAKNQMKCVDCCYKNICI